MRALAFLSARVAHIEAFLESRRETPLPPPRAPDPGVYREHDQGLLLVLGGTNRREKPAKRFEQAEDWSDPATYRLPGFETVVMTLDPAHDDPDKALVFEDAEGIVGINADFNSLEAWAALRGTGGSFDLVVFDWSTDKYFEWEREELVDAAVGVLRPGGAFWFSEASFTRRLGPRAPACWDRLSTAYAARRWTGVPLVFPKRGKKLGTVNVDYGSDGTFIELRRPASPSGS